MELYKELYHKLFAATADAVASLEKHDSIAAWCTLIYAMRDADEAIISSDVEI